MMNWMEMDRASSQRRFAELEATGKFEPRQLTPEYEQLRKQLLTALLSVPTGKLPKGQYDVEAGLALYTTLARTGFGMRHASSDGLWRHLSLEVVPDVVASRWEEHQAARFWSNRSRIWLRSLWWFVHLSWQESETSTRNILKGVTTDDIVQLVERPGRHGFRIDLCRAIMRAKSAQRLDNERFRQLMVLNTMKAVMTEPELHESGLEGYVTGLYSVMTNIDKVAKRKATFSRKVI